MNEEWRYVPGYEGTYSVSNYGRVRSEARTITRSNGTTQRVEEKLLATPPGGTGGYLTVTLWRNNKGQTAPVHTLIAAAFLGPRPEGADVCHNDDNPLNPRLDNLRYDTHQGNLMDSVISGRNGKITSHCPQNHAKVGYNRIEYGPFKTRSKCRACDRERHNSRKTGRPFDPLKSDEQYRKILEQDVQLNTEHTTER